MIEQATFQNFKNLRDVTIHFKTPLTVLVGPNGSGKTSILEGLALLTGLGAAKPQMTWHSSWLAQNEERYHLAIKAKTLKHKPYSVSIQIEPGIEDDLKLQTFFEGKSASIEASTREDFEKQVQESARGVFLHLLPAPSLVRLEMQKLAAVARPEGTTTAIGASGHGLAAALADMATGDPGRFAALQELLRSVVPVIKWVKLKRRSMLLDSPAAMMPSRRATSWGHKIFFDTKLAQDIPAELASEGTLLTLGILTIIEQASSRSIGGDLLLIDDLDRGLHPNAQRELLSAMRKLLEKRSGLQIVATSHSPYLLDCLKPEEVCMTALDEDGSALCGALTEHPDFPRWKDTMLPGEFWSSVGEDWLRGRQEKPGA